MSSLQSRYKLTSAIVNPSFSDTTSIDIRNNVIETHIYENLETPYVTCRIVVIDDFGFRDRLRIRGTERVFLEYSKPNDNGGDKISKNFFISRVIDVDKANPKAEVLSLELVEDHFWINSVKSISKSFTGSIEAIIRQIVTGEFSKVVRERDFTGTSQGERKVIVPYLTPIEAIQWIKTHGTTRLGAPIYCYSSFFESDILLSDLEGLLKREIFNKKFPLLYGQSIAALESRLQIARPYMEVEKFREVDTENSLELYEQGAIGSLYSMTDFGTGISNERHVSVRNILDELDINNVISSIELQSVFDPLLKIGDKLTDEYNSKYIFQITSGKTYNQFASLSEESDLTFSKLKAKNRILRLLLKKNTIDYYMEGTGYFEKKLGIGDRARIVFSSPNVSATTTTQDDQIDFKKSGDYLIFATHHILTEESHKVSIRATKLEDLSDDFEI
jgi:hypothetical protein